jgi:hypothetical protein
MLFEILRGMNEPLATMERMRQLLCGRLITEIHRPAHVEQLFQLVVLALVHLACWIRKPGRGRYPRGFWHPAGPEHWPAAAPASSLYASRSFVPRAAAKMLCAMHGRVER